MLRSGVVAVCFCCLDTGLFGVFAEASLPFLGTCGLIFGNIARLLVPGVPGCGSGCSKLNQVQLGEHAGLTRKRPLQVAEHCCRCWRPASRGGVVSVASVLAQVVTGLGGAGGSTQRWN